MPKETMNQSEWEAFNDAAESGVLCDPEYCPYMAGTVNTLYPCEGSWCEEAYQNYREQKAEVE